MCNFAEFECPVSLCPGAHEGSVGTSKHNGDGKARSLLIVSYAWVPVARWWFSVPRISWVVGPLGVSGPSATRGRGSRAGAQARAREFLVCRMQVQPDLFPAGATLELAEGPFSDITLAQSQTAREYSSRSSSRASFSRHSVLI